MRSARTDSALPLYSALPVRAKVRCLLTELELARVHSAACATQGVDAHEAHRSPRASGGDKQAVGVEAGHKATGLEARGDITRLEARSDFTRMKTGGDETGCDTAWVEVLSDHCHLVGAVTVGVGKGIDGTDHGVLELPEGHFSTEITGLTALYRHPSRRAVGAGKVTAPGIGEKAVAVSPVGAQEAEAARARAERVNLADNVVGRKRERTALRRYHPHDTHSGVRNSQPLKVHLACRGAANAYRNHLSRDCQCAHFGVIANIEPGAANAARSTYLEATPVRVCHKRPGGMRKRGGAE